MNFSFPKRKCSICNECLEKSITVKDIFLHSFVGRKIFSMHIPKKKEEYLFIYLKK